MTKRETVGKWQLILGIVVLLGTMAWVSCSYISINNQMENSLSVLGGDSNPFKDVEFSSNDTKLSAIMSYETLVLGMKMDFENQLFVLKCSAIILCLLSIILILEGLANMQRDKR
jgi:hypothetical protein